MAAKPTSPRWPDAFAQASAKGVAVVEDAEKDEALKRTEAPAVLKKRGRNDKEEDANVGPQKNPVIKLSRADAEAVEEHKTRSASEQRKKGRATLDAKPKKTAEKGIAMGTQELQTAFCANK